MPAAKHLFGDFIEPACQYCALGSPAQEEGMILCTRNGLVEIEYHCSRYTYDPLRRIPKRQPKLPVFNPEDFEL